MALFSVGSGSPPEEPGGLVLIAAQVKAELAQFFADLVDKKYKKRGRSEEGALMLTFDEQKMLLNLRNADTDDLLDRITADCKGLEDQAIDMVENELHERGITAAMITQREEDFLLTCRSAWAPPKKKIARLSGKLWRYVFSVPIT